MKRKKIVTIGGGTGNFVLLTGLKKYPVDISAIVCMTDDGGSTGILRDELGVLPPGDIRQCLIALSDSSETLRRLMGFRFGSGALEGHSFGNLMLSALEKIDGSFVRAVEEASSLLNIKGEVIPVSQKDIRLWIRLKNGKIIKGENELDSSQELRKTGLKEIYLKPEAEALPKAIERIMQADFIAIGPGDLYGTVLPTLLVGGISEALQKTRAKIVFNCNLTNKKGQTSRYDLDEYIDKIEECIGMSRIDFATLNNRRPPAALLRKYEQKEGKNSLVRFDNQKKKDKRYVILKTDLLQVKLVKKNKSDSISSSRSFIRHDSEKLAKAIMKIIKRE